MAVVEKTVDIIGDAAFCVMLLARSIPEGMPVDIYDDVLVKTRPHAMRNMSGLESVNFPNLTTLGKYSFTGCRDLKRAYLPLASTVAERAFFECPALVEVYAPVAKSLGEFAINSSSIIRVELPEVTTTTASALCFYGCSSLEEVILPKITYIGNSTFYACASLTQLDLPSIKSIGANILNNATSIEVVNLGPGIQSIHSNGFAGTPDGMIINLPVAEGAISGAPWGASNAVINYEVPYAGTVPIPES